MYEGQDFATFMYTVCNAYPNVETVIEKLIDYVSEEYKAFHAKTVSEHITLIWIQQRGKTYQVSRVSNIRDTTGFERYVAAHWDTDDLKEYNINIAYRVYKDEWYDWQTIKIANV